MCYSVCWKVREVLEALEASEVQDVQDVMRCALHCLLEMLEVQGVTEVMRRVLLCMLEAVEVPEVPGMLGIDAGDPGGDVLVLLRLLEAMSCVLLCLLEVLEVLEMMRYVLGTTLYAGRCGGFEISIVAVFSSQSTIRRSCIRALGSSNLCPFREPHFFHYISSTSPQRLNLF